MSEKSKPKTPAGRRAEKAIEKSRKKIEKANERAHKARDLLRKKYSVPDD
jgi:hypothetical protein